MDCYLRVISTTKTNFARNSYKQMATGCLHRSALETQQTGVVQSKQNTSNTSCSHLHQKLHTQPSLAYNPCTPVQQRFLLLRRVNKQPWPLSCSRHYPSSKARLLKVGILQEWWNFKKRMRHSLQPHSTARFALTQISCASWMAICHHAPE